MSTFGFSSFWKEINKESDRGCALFAAAHFDSLLEKLLWDKLVGKERIKDDLVSFNGPLGTFSNRISMRGFISALAYNDLTMVRKIRNEFGHSTEIGSFDYLKIKNFCSEFKYIVFEPNTLIKRGLFIFYFMACMAHFK